MHKISKLMLMLLFSGILLASCSPAQITVEEAAPSSTPASLVPETIPTDVHLPTHTPAAPPPTTAPQDTPEPVIAITPPSVPPGPTLERLAPGTQPYFDRLQMFDTQLGWAIGGLEFNTDHIFITQDGGGTWRDVTPPQPDRGAGMSAAAFFLNTSTAWVTFSNQDTLLPEFPTVWRTLDGGESWQPSQLLDLADLSQSYATDLYFVDGLNGWLLTHVGVGMSHDYVTLFRTSDGGLTWQRLIDPYSDIQIQACQKTGLLFLDDQAGWLTGDCGGVMAGVYLNRTGDGGVTWTYVNLPAPADNPQLFDVNTPAACGGYDLRFFDPYTAVLGVRCNLFAPDSAEPVSASYLYTTLDGGETWSSLPYPGGTLWFVSPKDGWALAHDIYQTSNGGATWNLVNDVHWDASFSFISLKLGWAASYTETEQALVGTRDGGANWFMLEPVIAP